MKLLLGKTCPPLSFFNKVNGGWRNASNNSQRVSGYSGSKGFSDVDDLPLGQLVPWSIFAHQVNKPSAPLVSGVFGPGNPLKVFWSVIKFVAVDMIYRKPFSVPINERHGNKPMNKNFWAFGAKFCRNNVITVFGNPSLYLCLRPDAFKSLGIAKPRSFSFSNCFWAKYSSIFRHKPVNAFFVNSFSVHAVNCIAGHR